MTPAMLRYSLRRKEQTLHRVELELERTRRALDAVAGLNFAAQQDPKQIRTVKLKLRRLNHEVSFSPSTRRR